MTVIDDVKIIGERINPTGKKRFKEALFQKEMDYILRQAIEQIDAGAEILDVNVGLPGIDERQMMVDVVTEIQAITDVPLQIDSSSPEVIEAALRVYNGKALVNSVNGSEESLKNILPIVKKYGAAVVGLALDENGVPESAKERIKIAERIIARAEKEGILREDIFIDTLTLTAAAQQQEVKETVFALQEVKRRFGVKTVLGVSNVSFGLPERELLNRTFLSACLAAGLDLPIINPNLRAMTDTISAFRVLWGKDKESGDYLQRFASQEPISKKEESKDALDLKEAILKGLREDAKILAKELLKEKEPLEIVNRYLIPALDETGVKFEKGEVFLPMLMQTAETAKNVFEVIKEYILSSGKESIKKEKMIVATVEGDIHDIGKNIAKVLLENYGYDVIDLGRDVPSDRIVEETLRNDVKLVGLSALMTTTLKSMEETVEKLKKQKPDTTVFVAGAVVNEEYSKKIGAVYARDAKESVEIAKKVLG